MPIAEATQVGEISAYMGLVLLPAEIARPISYPGWENLGRGDVRAPYRGATEQVLQRCYRGAAVVLLVATSSTAP